MLPGATKQAGAQAGAQSDTAGVPAGAALAVPTFEPNQFDPEENERHLQQSGKNVRSGGLSLDPRHIVANAAEFMTHSDPNQSRHRHSHSEDEDMPFGGEADLDREAVLRNQVPDPARWRRGLAAELHGHDELRARRKIFNKFWRKRDKEAKKAPAPEADDEATSNRANLVVKLLALGGPLLNLLASSLCEDEFGTARTPLLLTLLGFHVLEMLTTKHNIKFRIDLEYGIAEQRLKWSVEKTIKDLLYLHSRFKLSALRGTIRLDDLPKFPVPPRLKRRGRKGKHDDVALAPVVDDSDDHTDADHARLEPDHARTEHDHDNRLGSVSLMSMHLESHKRRQEREQYTRDVAKYLASLIALVAMRPQSNRLFHFFELSPILSLLSYERGYVGKQGTVHIGSSAGSQGWRVGHFKANDIKGMINRRQEKWFLVRSTYVMYVDDINSTVPLDVFMVDPMFTIKGPDKVELRDTDSESDYDEEYIDSMSKTIHKPTNKVFSHLRITLENSERKLVIIPKSLRERRLWMHSLNQMRRNNIWNEPHRFESFAPVRKNAYAQWFVDARDHFWAISSALEMAKDTIFIHDWWLSPELYLRRPANGNQQFRLDRVLQRKAKQGVKIFVVLYRNVGTTVPIDSLYTKHSILSLNQENIHVIRSPNQFLQNTYFWAHHEKICIVDYNIAFCGGIDLCYGRYDTADHVVVDDSPIDFDKLDAETLTKDDFLNFRIFPGKDYSNPREKDFHDLDKPYEDLYDRNKVPRMPWHDILMVTSGQVARDLARHFVQRWNYVLRQKRPSRWTPLLVPPPEMTPEEVKALKLDGSCEVQVLRSSGNWSLGLKEHEESIHQAYLKLIETSEHFVYIENQFFVTSCEIDGIVVKNKIGDALVDRIVRAHRNKEYWKAVVVIPLVPGFESLVDKPDGSSVRVVMQCEYMSISRGLSCMFAKLRRFNIDPEDYIQFYSLRKWGPIGPDRSLVTEQLYIHAKVMVVDDRAAIIGSANINERSMRGLRDSEVACVVRDSTTIDSVMNGEPYKVGKFPHTLRMRLMREHLGVAVDTLDIVERKFDKLEQFARTPEGIQACTNLFANEQEAVVSAVVELATREILGEPDGTQRWRNHCSNLNIAPRIPVVPGDVKLDEPHENVLPMPLSFNNRTGPHEANKGIRDHKKHSYDTRVQHSEAKRMDVYGDGPDRYRSRIAGKARKDSARFIKELAVEAMNTNPDKTFLPNIEQVKSFLENDDDDLHGDLSREEESIIAARNRERLLLLKKIAYLQRVAAKERIQSEGERKKRLHCGLPGSVYEGFAQQSPKIATTNGSMEPETYATNNIVSSVQVPGSYSDDPLSKEVIPEKDIIETGSEFVSVVQLDESQTKEVIESVNLPGVSTLNKFIDPYGFVDPIDLDFYEDIWYETARRNTDIFRMVFHCQPDNEVPSWKEYKQYMKLENAFRMSQAQEGRNRRENNRFDNESSQLEEMPRPPHTRKSSQATINLNELRQEKGVFGEDPTRPRVGAIAEGNESEDDSEMRESSSVSNSTDEPNVEEKLEKRKRQARRRKGPFSARRRAHGGDRIFERDSAERLLREVHGHLVLFPVDWLQTELEGDNWFYNTDRIPPVEIYD